MGARVRGVAVVVVVLAVGAFLGSALGQRWSRPADSGAEEASVPQVSERVRVEVLNGGGKGHMARAATDRLRRAGFDVVFFGNAGAFDRDSSVVLDRVGRPAWAQEVARALGIESVASEPDTNLYLDVTVVLGKEWEPAGPPTTEAASEARPWWDLRRLFRKRPGAPATQSRLANPGDDEEGGT